MATKLTRNFGKLNRLVPLIKKDYSKRLRTPLKLAILKDISRGVSPVRSKGRFKKYSNSYKSTIRGKSWFFKVNGKLVVLTAGRGETFPTVPFFTGKKISPVNLKVSGAMLKSLKVRTLGSGITNRIEIAFEDDVAFYHNNTGVGPQRIKRRLLPTESDDKGFNRKITALTIRLLETSTSRIIQKFNSK